MSVLSERVWAGEYFGPRGALTEGKRKARELWKMRDYVGSVSTLSSLYYSAATRLRADARSASFPRNLVLRGGMVWYLLRARWHANRMVGFAEGDLHKLHADKLDVRQSVLRATAFIPGSLGKAVICIDEALGRKHLKLHTQALLRIGRGDIHERRGNLKQARDSYEQAYRLVADVIAASEFAQASRICRHYADFCERRGMSHEARRARERAQRYAELGRAPDQLRKLKL